jgi:hypothetical protein
MGIHNKPPGRVAAVLAETKWGSITGRLLLEPTGRLLLEPTGRLLLEPTGRLLLEPTGRLLLESMGRLLLEPTGRLLLNNLNGVVIWNCRTRRKQAVSISLAN